MSESIATTSCTFDTIPDDLTHTWSYSALLQDRTNVEYAFLYAQKALEDACPVHLAHEWETINERLKALLRAFTTAKIDLTENCFLTSLTSVSCENIAK